MRRTFSRRSAIVGGALALTGAASIGRQPASAQEISRRSMAPRPW